MSKRQSTLFQFFSSPKVAKDENKKRVVDDVDNEEIITFPRKRSRQIINDSSESEHEENETISKKVCRGSSGSETENSTPNKLKINKRKEKSNHNDEVNNKVSTVGKFSFQKSSLNEPSEENVNKFITEGVKDIHSSWLHNTLNFLKPHLIMDANKRKPNDPDYDSRTLYVPEQYLNSLTPAMRQWWELKSQHMDSILFFKVGKFYELYHMDAVIGATHIGLTYMKGEFAHSGFPETSYGKMATMLMDKGYKVARVEQTETADMLAERSKSVPKSSSGKTKSSKFDKVVKREICQISAKASCVYTAQMPEWHNETPYFLYALCIKEIGQGVYRSGICFVETSMGAFRLSEFEDDRHFSKLLILFTEYPPTLILVEKGGGNKQLTELLNTQFRDVKKEYLKPKTQFYTASDTLEKLASACYFRNKEGDFSWPEIFRNIADDCIPKIDCELVVRCLGAIMWYLMDSKLDIQVLSLQKFEWYDTVNFKMKASMKQDYLILDAMTVENLQLLGSCGTLRHVLDHCKTPFGRRLLLRWICRPLCDPLKIEERQNAIKYLVNDTSLLQNTQAVLEEMPDLERLLMKIHVYGNKYLATNHPDARAVLYEAKTYSKNKIKDFLKTIKAFKKSLNIVDLFQGREERLLKKLTQYESTGGMFVDLSDTLTYFTNAFDQEQAEKEGTIIPIRGVVDEFDEVENRIDGIKGELNEYLEQQRLYFDYNVTYAGTDKKRYQLVVPQEKSDRATDEYRLESATKGAKPIKKFTTFRTRELLAEMMEEESRRADLIVDLNRKIFEKFSNKYEQFDQVIQCLTILDVICSLAEYARTCSYDICLPKILPFSEEPKLLIENGTHPCAVNVESFVPNDIKMGVEGFPNLLIITGPNMGGKSTLMRQIAVISVMAQMGSFVPASKCELNLIDRIFARLGAQDDILKSQSTFYVELSEASSILHNATKHSLLIIDELGRGTSTHDGNAIATSYVDKLTTFKCRTTFSTHYHSLVDHFVGRRDVQLGHMGCMTENDEDPSMEHITFLYKIASGTCPKSYGFNAARLAGLDRRLIVRGMEATNKLEGKSNRRNIFQTVPSRKKSVREALALLSF